MMGAKRFVPRKAAVLLAWLAVAACDARGPKPLVESAKFGVFYGGQIQEREQVPFELDRTKQEQGFRIIFSEPLRRPLPIRWELDVPSGAARKTKTGRLVELGEATVRSGQRRFEHLIRFEPEDLPGTWNLRVLVDDQLVIDRAFLVVDAEALRRSRAGGR